MPSLRKKPKKPKISTLDRALNRIYRLHDKQIDLNLDRVHRLLHDLDNPQDKTPPVLHIAGTNGKGSTLAYIQAILESAGYSIHKHTSPHLVRFNERIVLNGHEISDQALLPLIHFVEERNQNQPITFFEFCMGMNFHAFSQHPADAVLLETGLGGRLDASNVVQTPLATLISKIGLDHMKFLGDNVIDIAKEKAGIMKPGTPCFVSRQSDDTIYDVFWQKATALDVPLYIYGKDWETIRTEEGFDLIIDGKTVSLPLPNLVGDHQIDNAALAIACLYYLNHFDLSQENFATGIRAAKWPARMQHLSHGALVNLVPKDNQIWLDGGHNSDGTQAIAKILNGWQTEGIKIHLIFGTLENRDPLEVISPLLPFIESLQTIDFDYPKARKAQEATNLFEEKGIKAIPYNSIEEALSVLSKKIDQNDRILICGSLYLAGKILQKNLQFPLA